MRTSIAIFLIIILGLMTSCYEIYNPIIDTKNKVLVVSGIITNKTDAYHVFLSYAEPFNSIKNAEPVQAAIVYVTDDLENRFLFDERGNGNYYSDSLKFTGQPGRSYRLHIVTSDGTGYESDSQQLFPEALSDAVYAEFDIKETLDKNSGLKFQTHGANILIDILNQSDTLPRYRFTSNLVTQYLYKIVYQLSWDTYFVFNFYCWRSVNPNSNIDLTGGEYSLNSASVRKHPVCFLDDNYSVYASHYDLRFNEKDSTGSAIEINYQFYDIHNRILYLNQYTLNNESYFYYKSMDEQMQSEGKLFDPIAAQLNGNIKCITDPGKRAIGFFEASSVNCTAYIVDFRNLINAQPTLIRTPYILTPEANGLRINRIGSPYQDHNIPAFWIFK